MSNSRSERKRAVREYKKRLGRPTRVGEHVKCNWCSRDGVLVTDKGGLSPHLTFGGQHCVGTGMVPPTKEAV